MADLRKIMDEVEKIARRVDRRDSATYLNGRRIDAKKRREDDEIPLTEKERERQFR